MKYDDHGRLIISLDGVDLLALQTDVDEFPDELKNLIDHEIQQLETLGGVTTISAAQWGFLGDMSYGVVIGSVPAFLIVKTSHQLNFAINADVTVTFDDEIYDIGGNFAANTFTAPVTGKYHLDANLRLDELDQAATYYALKIITSKRTYASYINVAQFVGDVSTWHINLSVTADMDADDTAYVVIYQAGGGVQTDVWGGVVVATYFSGVLVA